MYKRAAYALLGILLFSGRIAMASLEDEKALVVQLLSATGTVESLEKGIVGKVSARMAELRQSEKYRDLPDQFFSETEEETIEIIRTVMDDKDVILSRLTRIYTRRFTEQELRTLVEFYRTPLGQKVVSVTPSINSEFEAASESIEQELIVPKVIRVVQSKLERYGNPPSPGNSKK